MVERRMVFEAGVQHCVGLEQKAHRRIIISWKTTTVGCSKTRHKMSDVQL
jgi:hypothetical protein